MIGKRSCSQSHDASSRELTTQLNALRDLVDERDKRYDERFKSQDKAVDAAFAAQKEAIAKAESAQLQYNVVHNDLNRKMDAQYQQMLPRHEADSRFQTLTEKISDLLDDRMSRSGREIQSDKSRDWLQWALPIVISIFSLAAVIIIAFIVKR
jgi:phosphopantetheinyl transferase (holo-ACP synthase)